MHPLDFLRSQLSDPTAIESPENALSESAQTLLSCGTESSQQTNEQPRPYRFRPDSWLSNEDADFLLKKRASWEAKHHNYRTAIALLNKLTTIEPNSAEHYANRGLMYSQLEEYSKALADYNRAISLDPELDSAYNNRANLHANCHHWSEAIFDYDEALDLNPLNVRARLNQAITFRQMGHYTEALDCLEIALFFMPQSALLYAESGRTYHLRGDWNCAIAHYNTALTLTQLPDQLGDISDITHRVKTWMSSLT
ncbi:MAG: tetratricopeptide repeat protein [Cyanobacteria bacterium J06634_5]